MPSACTPSDGTNWWPNVTRYAYVNAGVVTNVVFIPVGQQLPVLDNNTIAVQSDMLKVGDTYTTTAGAGTAVGGIPASLSVRT